MSDGDNNEKTDIESVDAHFTKAWLEGRLTMHEKSEKDLKWLSEMLGRDEANYNQAITVYTDRLEAFQHVFEDVEYITIRDMSSEGAFYYKPDKNMFVKNEKDLQAIMIYMTMGLQMQVGLSPTENDNVLRVVKL